MENKNPVIYYSFDAVPTLAELEKKHILTALHHCGQNKSKAHKMLGISLKTLYNKLHEYGILKTNENKSSETPEGKS